MFEKIIVIAVVVFVLLMCGISLYRTFTGKGKSCSSCCGDGSCCMKKDAPSEQKKP